MKILKRLFAVVLTLVLSLFAINAASAAENDGTITVNGTTSGKNYEIYRIFDLTLSATGNIAYTVNNDWTRFFEDGQRGANYLTDTNSGSLSSITVSGVIKYINITNDNVADFAQDALDYASKNSIVADYNKEAEGTTLTFTSLEYGYYLVYPKGATDIKDSYASICSLTSTTPNGIVSIKAEYPEIEKEVDDHSVEVGQEVTFTITGQVPDTTGYTTYTYEIKDTMSAGLLFNESIATLELTIADEKINIAGNENVTITYTDNAFILTIDMTKFQGTDRANVGEDVVVTYKAKVTEAAINSTTTKNSAVLTYSNDPKDSTSKTKNPPVEEYVYSADILVEKVDGTDNTVKLAGAEFILTKKVGDTIYYYQISSEETDKVVTWTTNKDEATKYTTDANGNVTFAGLEDGTYYLVETKAPDGYNLLVNPVAVEVNNELNKTSGVPVITQVTSVVENNSGTELPTTGGFGTKLFITIGSLLAAVSAVLLITNKRMAKEL